MIERLVEINGENYSCTLSESSAMASCKVLSEMKSPIQVVGFELNEFTETVFILMGLLLITVIFRIVVSNLPKKFSFITKYIPESGCIIIVGVLIGGIIRLFQRFSGHEKFNLLLSFNDQFFFLVLIPPLILESGYFLNKEFFSKHLALILLYAVLGTFLNSIATGAALWAFGFTRLYKFSYNLASCLLFGSLICATDPIAVLSIFDDIKVNEMLYMLVFGESVLNDSVSIVLYNLFSSMTKAPVSTFTAIHFVYALAKLAYISVVGVGVGLTFGFIGSFLTRFTRSIPLIEPMVVLLSAFASYFFAETILSSGIVAILFCGIFMSRYVELNISKKSHTTLKYGLKLIATTAETLIFIYLGISLVLHHHVFDWGFTAATLFFILFFRFFFTFSITVVYNMIRKKYGLSTVSNAEQFILSYSGLRGIVFALALIIPVGSSISQEQKNAIISSTMIVSCFTIFFQGSTIRPIMKMLSIKKDKQTYKQVSQTLISERVKLNMEEVEITNALKTINYLESTLQELPADSLERKEFEEANNRIMERYIYTVLDEIESLNEQIIDYNDSYLNSDEIYDLIESRSDICDRIVSGWRKHIENIGLDGHSEASCEVMSTLRATILKSTKQNVSPCSNANDIECPVDIVVQDKETGFLFDILEETNVIHWDDKAHEYIVTEWAKDERFIFYLERLLQEENINFWIDQANDILQSNNFSKTKSLLKALRSEVQRQQEIRRAEIDNLKRIFFAAKVFNMGIRSTMDAINIIAGTKDRGSIYAKKFDKFMQKICVRDLYAEEYALVRAMGALKKFEENFSANLSITSEEQEEQFISSLEEQEKAIRVVQEASENENVNFKRIMSETDLSASQAGSELSSLLELEKDEIDDKEYEERIQHKKDLASDKEKEILKAAQLKLGDTERDEYCEKFKEAQKRYELKLAEIEAVSPPPHTGPSPSIFTRNMASDHLSPFSFSPMRRHSECLSARVLNRGPSPRAFSPQTNSSGSNTLSVNTGGAYNRRFTSPNIFATRRRKSLSSVGPLGAPHPKRPPRKRPSIADRRGIPSASEINIVVEDWG